MEYNKETKSIRLPLKLLTEITNNQAERNIYIHPNPLARDIFWQRLECLMNILKKSCSPKETVLDLGGGSGVFLNGLSKYFEQVDILDWDVEDSRQIKKIFNLKNVNIFQNDMRTFEKNPYDTIIMADVLEHFHDLREPLQVLKRLLKPNTGKLFVSLPTENWLYVLGRKMVGKTKPADHYHTADEVLTFLRANGFQQIFNTSRPQFMGCFKIPLFRIAGFIYKN